MIKNETMEQAPGAEQLAALLYENRDEITTSWAEMVHALPGSRYSEYPVAEICEWLSRGLKAAIESLSSGSTEATEIHLREIAMTRLQMGFNISEVIEGLLLLKDAARTPVQRAYPAGSDQRCEALSGLDAYLRFMVGRFGHLYAQAVDTELRRSEEHLRTVADFTYDWEYWIGADGRYLWVSPSCERITGYRADEFSQDPGLLERIILADDRASAAAHLREEPLEGSHVLPMEFRITARSGEVRWLEHGCQAVYDTAGSYLGRRGSNRDITERKRAEEVVEQHARERAVAAERNRLARELHDSVTQALYSVSLHAEAAGLALSAGNQDVVGASLTKLKTMTREAMLDLRMLIFELHPPLLQEEGLVAALRARLATVETRAGLQTDINVMGEERMPLVMAEELFWIAVEAFNNVLKHANAHLVTVDLIFDDPIVLLNISDDGLGFDPTEASGSGGMGLRGMAERVDRIGGTLEVESGPERGTTVRVETRIQRTGGSYGQGTDSSPGRR